MPGIVAIVDCTHADHIVYYRKYYYWLFPWVLQVWQYLGQAVILLYGYILLTFLLEQDFLV